MPAETSAGILLYRRRAGALEVFLVHPGGPFWARRDLGAWTVPKGAPLAGESLVEAARREFNEETGFSAEGELLPLGHVRQKAGKIVHAWALEGDADPAALKSNTFQVEWPRGSGRLREYPEADRGGWFPMPEARARILPSQSPLLDALLDRLSNTDGR